MTRNAHNYETHKGVFMIDREILWKRVKVVEIKDVNAYAHKKEEAR